MGYDLEFVQVAVDKNASFPIDAEATGALLRKPIAFKDPAVVSKALLRLEGAKPGPGGTIDYLATGLSYARFTIEKDRVHVDNNLNCAGLLKIYEKLRTELPSLLIRDLQSGQLHDAASYQAWWSKPL